MNNYSVSGECNHCKNKRTLAGETHIACAKADPEMVGHEHGIKMGWFSYPFNFDPVWKAKRCNKFEEKQI